MTKLLPVDGTYRAGGNGNRILEIREDNIAGLSDYATVPISFWVRSRLAVLPVEGGLGGLRLVEEPVMPYLKDYDLDESERPEQWPRRWDIARWVILAAFVADRRVGGAVVPWQTPGVDVLEGRDDLACLWDLRVHPDFRGLGVGHELFTRALAWSRARSCRCLKVETQNTNVAACGFYARQGCILGAINGHAYAPALDEVQLLWYRAVC